MGALPCPERVDCLRRSEDWSAHDIGHELTAFHGIAHARTLAIVQPGLWKALRRKEGKLLQYGKGHGKELKAVP